jgi:GNAT superfamily N-acetyltransferase
MECPVIPMSWEEFEVMEEPFGWKVEYWDGHAHLTPRFHGVKTKLQLSVRHAPPNPSLVDVSPDYRDAMLAGYGETFGNSIEFCGWSRSDIEASAVTDIGNYFAGKRGEPLAASVLALVPGSQALVGLALISRRPKYGAYLDLLYVRPAFQRQGVGTAMLNRAIDCLVEAGFPTLTSAYHIVNEPSRRWHHGHGFEDLYDWYYAKLKVGWYEREIWRRERLGLVEGLDELRRECECWAARAQPEDLEAFLADW